MPSATRDWPRIARPLCGFVLLLSLAPLFVGAARKFATFGRADVLLSAEEAGYRVLSVGSSARDSRLLPGDLVVLLDGGPALEVRTPSRRLAASPADLTLLRDGRLVSVRSGAVPAPWDLRWVVLLVVGLGSLVAAAMAAWAAPRAARPGANFLFAGFGLCLALLLALTPSPPVDGFFRAATLLEEAARALGPAFLLAFVFTFPRPARRVRPWLFFVPAALLLAESARVYLLPGLVADAPSAVRRLDVAEALWIGASFLLAAGRVVTLSRRTTDLLTEKQVRFLVLGTAVGLSPVAVFGLLPFAFGTSLPVLTTLSLVPLLLVPAAFLAALLRYRLWDVEVLGREAAATIGAGALGAALFAGAQLLSRQPLLTALPYAGALVETAAGLAIAVSVVPVRRGLSGALSRLQHGDRTAEREALLGVARELLSPRRTSEIGALLSERVTRGLGLSPAVLLPVEGELVDASAVDGGPPLPLSELPATVARRPSRLSRHLLAAAPSPAVARLRQAGF
ncbi:hypothetical protein FBQ97_15330, partial [Acidobacteria bacterium ACD]|nr:hypothetical protein [Acidobacteria bacterium ACD]